MAIDYRQERMSVMNMGCPWRPQLPIGDGTISQADRAHLLYLYAGIAITAPVRNEITIEGRCITEGTGEYNIDSKRKIEISLAQDAEDVKYVFEETEVS